MRPFRLVLAQINSTVGDFATNAEKVIAGMRQAKELGADLVAFPELAITGYPPEDLLLKPSFLQANKAALEHITTKSGDTTAVVGCVDAVEGCVYNAAALLHQGRLVSIFHKHLLPDYGVFDEERYFTAGFQNYVFVIAGVKVGITVCEDLWHAHGPMAAQAGAGASLVVSINASPYHSGKQIERENMISRLAADNRSWVAYVNCVGGQDELVFDGGSFVCDARGEVVARTCQFQEDVLAIDITFDDPESSPSEIKPPKKRKPKALSKRAIEVIEVSSQPAHAELPSIEIPSIEPLTQLEEIYQALVTGTRDYVIKNGFQDVILGLSGGVDSSLVACIAADAVGPENVLGLILPSRFSSPGSIEDARNLAENLGIQHRTLSIDELYGQVVAILGEGFDADAPQQPEENIQARMRAVLWMALSNRLGSLVLVGGNKSEVATGYATLYGDMAGGFSPLKDVYKTLVYKLAAYRNEQGEKPVIPADVLTKEPSAELRPNQSDSDSLPPYDVLDPILEGYIEGDLDFEDLVERCFDAEDVKCVLNLVDRNEFKRRQGPVGVKITERAFGRDRRMPITNAFPKNRPSCS
ncbi:MAG TPA: NAD+ synthase [Anaerolineae bacterium]|nr:NAD+ synthase [Anaerolineae bacterium]